MPMSSVTAGTSGSHSVSAGVAALSLKALAFPLLAVVSHARPTLCHPAVTCGSSPRSVARPRRATHRHWSWPRRTASADDVVVVAFSGHGSDTHQLVTHDADPYNLPSTSLPLDEFTDLVSAIPARQLIVILDCCFSVGAGAKVLNAPFAPRGGTGGLPTSTDARLEKMAG